MLLHLPLKTRRESLDLSPVSSLVESFHKKPKEFFFKIKENKIKS
jgi:hypothetical protein